MRTESEELFERFCSTLGVKCEPIAPSSGRTADFRLFPANQLVIAEVKQLEPNADDLAHALEVEAGQVAVRSYPVGKRLRQEIADSNAQIRSLAKGKCPGLLVVYNNIPFGHAHTDPMMVLIAMYGQLQAIVAVPHDKHESPYLTDTRFGGNRGVTEGQNTSLSAVCILQEGNGGPPGLTFYHNAFAAVSFDPNWLRSPTVRHYEIKDAASHRFDNWVEI